MSYPITISQGWSELVDEVDAELKKARAKFPGNYNLTMAMAEESGELVRAVLNRWHRLHEPWDVAALGRPFDEAEPKWRAEIRKEAIQTMAMCVRLVLEGDPAQSLPGQRE